MDITPLTGISSDYLNSFAKDNSLVDTSDDSFSSVLDSALSMLNETNDLQNKAESAEIQFALGDAENTHDLQIALQKANVALQYTVAVRDKMLDAYKEIMNMSI